DAEQNALSVRGDRQGETIERVVDQGYGARLRVLDEQAGRRLRYQVVGNATEDDIAAICGDRRHCAWAVSFVAGGVSADARDVPRMQILDEDVGGTVGVAGH